MQLKKYSNQIKLKILTCLFLESLYIDFSIVEGSQGIENDIYSIASEFATKENIKSLVVYSKVG